MDHLGKTSIYAEKILVTGRDRLVMSYPFLARAVYALTLTESGLPLCGTDGEKFWYDPERIVVDFVEAASFESRAEDAGIQDGTEVLRQDPDGLYLHSMLHCLYLHPFFAQSHEKPELWDIAADVAVWDILEHLNPDVVSEGMKEALRGIRGKVYALHTDQAGQGAFTAQAGQGAFTAQAGQGALSAQGVYRFLSRSLENRSIPEDELRKMGVFFAVDDHIFWKRKEAEEEEQERDGQESDKGESTGKRKNRRRGEKGREELDEEPDDGEKQIGEEQEREDQGGDEVDEEPDREQQDDAEEQAGEGQEHEDQVGDGVDEEPDRERQAGKGQDQEQEREDQGGDGDDGEAQDGEEQDEGEQAGQGDTGAGSVENGQQLLQTWQDIADHAEVGLEMELQKRSRQRGEGMGQVLESLRNIQRDKESYEEFLRKFAVLEERMKVDLDSFDYNYYTYGLELYGDMPLIEPLEYKEMHTIREFVVAIDTSGSCDLDLVRKFLEKTYSILSEEEVFEGKLTLHLIQCDAGIQEDVLITSREELEHYIQNFKIRGRGGTDFRPVFERVKDLQKQGELSQLRGLLYFTDGYGTFPKEPAPYKTAFVFAEMDGNVRVPPWAMRVYLDEEFG